MADLDPPASAAPPPPPRSISAELAGLVAVVTGGASGIGAAAVAELRARGAHVAVLDRTTPPERHPHDQDDAFFPADVTDRGAIESAFAEIVRRRGRLDILVNCAGIECRGPLEEVDDDEAERVLNVNVLGMMRTMRAASPHLRASGGGSIVNVGSVSAAVGMAGLAVYSASKGAVAAMTRAVAAEMLPHGIRANCVTPATVDTPWIERTLASTSDPDGAATALRARQPMGRLVAAEEVAAAVAYLVSPSARSVTGTSLDIDGGMLTLSPAADVSRVGSG